MDSKMLWRVGRRLYETPESAGTLPLYYVIHLASSLFLSFYRELYEIFFQLYILRNQLETRSVKEFEQKANKNCLDSKIAY